MGKISIAIDGLSASGKSTIARLAAKELGYSYLDTGAMYRCIALYVYNQGINPDDHKQIVEVLKDITIHFDHDAIYLNHKDVSLDIRQEYISRLTPKISSYQEVRQFLVKQQQQIAKNKGIILDGRDIGSVVLPEAELKIYQFADVDCRAKRRHEENIKRGIESDLETIKQDVIKRDYEDTHKEFGALIKCDDAIELDTTNITIDEAVTIVVNLARQRMKEGE